MRTIAHELDANKNNADSLRIRKACSSLEGLQIFAQTHYKSHKYAFDKRRSLTVAACAGVHAILVELVILAGAGALRALLPQHTVLLRGKLRLE